MIRKIAFTFWLIIPGLFLYAQNQEQRAQELLDLVIRGEGDSIYTRINEDMRSKTNVAMFNVIFRALERKYGNYESREKWVEETIPEATLYTCEMKFDNNTLKFITAFDSDGKANTLRFTPKDIKAKEADLQPVEGVEEEAVKITTGDYTLPGTLVFPKGRRKPPVAILVHGTGPCDRDETIGPNKPFRDLAMGLAKQGIAVLRYDKRTFVYKDPSAAGNFDEETVDDVLSAIALMKKNKRIDPDKIFIIGHSLGGMLAPRIAEQSEGSLAGIVMIAANARPLEDLLHEQILYIAEKTGSDELEKGQIEQIRKQIVNARVAGTYAYNPKIGLPFNTPLSYWEFANKYKQVKVAQKLNLPMLLLQGERDYQVTMKDFRLWEKELAGKKNVTFQSYPQLNHMLQEGSGMSTPFEYEKESHVPGYVIDDIFRFINQTNP